MDGSLQTLATFPVTFPIDIALNKDYANGGKEISPIFQTYENPLLTLLLNENHLTVLLNETVVGDVTDSSISSPGSIGIKASLSDFPRDNSDIITFSDFTGFEGAYSESDLNIKDLFYFKKFSGLPFEGEGKRPDAYSYYDIFSPLGISSVGQPPLAPMAPTAFVAAAVGTNINLSWVDNSNNETGFKIERALVATGPWTALPSLAAANALSAGDGSLSQKKKYFYRISAVNVAGASGFASTSVTLGYAKPNAPTAVALSVASATSVKVTWVDNSSLKTGYKIEKATSSSGPWVAVTPNLRATVQKGTVLGLATKIKYFFRVTTLNNTNASDPSAAASITSGVPSAPTALSATASSATSVKLAWVDSNDNETAIAIYMKKGASGAYAALTPAAAVGEFAYAKSRLLANTTYFFKVRATNLAGFSESAAVSITTPK